MVEVFTTSGAAKIKAGEGVDSSISSSGAAITRFLEESEAFINLNSLYDYTTGWANLEANMKKSLSECSANLAAIYMIEYNMAGYTTRIEAEDMINILWARAQQILRILKEHPIIKKVKG